jgi:hypothetical protein
MASSKIRIISMPMLPGEEALKVFETTLRASVVNIIAQNNLKWNTVSIAHRGRDPQHLDQCPPTIIITTNESTLKQPAWKTVESKVRESIAKITKIRIEVEIAPGVPIAFTRINVGLPYPRPPTIGSSFGPAKEEIKRTSETYSGTLGGYLILPEHQDMKVALTCNHVANPRDLVLASELPESESRLLHCYLHEPFRI